MNKVFYKYASLILFLLVVFKGMAQSPCYTNNLSVSTGYNHLTSSVYPDGALDNLWNVSAAPTGPLPRPANVIDGQTWGHPPFNITSKYIHYASTQNNLFTNMGDYCLSDACGPLGAPVIYTYTFCLEGPIGDLVLNMNVKADNMAKVYFNYTSLPGGSFVPTLISPAPSLCPEGWVGGMNITSTNFRIGINKIQIEVYSGCSAMGLCVTGKVYSPSGTSYVNKPECCVQNSSIAGKCFLDTYGPNDGIYTYGQDGTIQGINVYLEKEVSSVWTAVANQATNGSGDYLFGGLAHGNYRLSQAPFNSFPLTVPLTNSGYHYVTIGGNSNITGKDFGNSLFLCCDFNSIYTNPNPACKDESTNFILNDCFPNVVNTSYNYTWTYGDGSPAFVGLNASHTYQAAGSYNVTMQAVDPTGKCPTVSRNTNVVVNDQCCPNCIPSFQLIPGRKYVLSAWVSEEARADQEETFYDPEIWLEFPSVIGTPMVWGPFKGKGNIIDGWQRIEDEFVVPFSATGVKVKLMSRSGASEPVYFDDVRIHPFDAGFKSYVYDPVTLKFVAELDNNNYATFYEYDEEGKLVRVKKETERKTVTIKESRNSSIKR